MAMRIIQEVIPNKSSETSRLQFDIFDNQKVELRDSRCWSRYLVTENRDQAKVSAVSSPQALGKKIRASVCTQLPEVDADLVPKHWNTEVKTQEDLRESLSSTPPAPSTLLVQELNDTYKTIQTEEKDVFEDVFEDNSSEMMEEDVEPQRERSIQRRFLIWLDDYLKTHYMKKVARTYMREMEEGNQIYRNSFMSRLTTRAQREQEKRRQLLYLDQQRQRVKDLLDVYWYIQEQQKEDLIAEEEARFLRWLSEHDISLDELSLGENQRHRMSKREKRFLRLRELLCCF